MRYIVLIGLFACCCKSTDTKQSDDYYWSEITIEKSDELPEEFQGYNLNIDALKEMVKLKSIIQIPTPKGEFIICELKESGTMSPELAAKYPEIKSYTVIKNNSVISGRIDINPSGFYAMIIDENSTFFINPIEKKSKQHICYDKSQAVNNSDNPFIDKVIK